MENKKILTWRGKLSCNSVTLALFLSFGIASNALALECSEGAIACGDDCAAEGATCKWEISSTGQLTISGDGAMKDYSDNRTMAGNDTVSGTKTTPASYGDYWDKITGVTIEEGITSAGKYAFEGLSQVTSVSIPKSLESIGYATFDRMPQMSSFNVPADSKLKSLDSGAFQFSTSLNNSDAQTIINTLAANNSDTYTLPWNSFSHSNIDEITIPSGIEVGLGAFNDNRLQEIIIPDGTKTISSSAFQNNQLQGELVIPDSVETIGGSAFMGNEITSVVWPEGLTEIKSSAFRDNQLTSIDIPDTVTKIGTNAFQNNQLSGALIIPDSVTTIAAQAFQGNNLTSVYIPDSVTKLGQAFWNNPNLKDIIISDNVNTASWTANDFSQLPANATIHCQGDIDKCTAAMAKFISSDQGGNCKSTNSYCLKAGVKIVEAKDEYCTGKCNGTSCQLTKYYFNGSTCIKEPDASKRTCDYETSGYIKMGNYCASPETTYAKKHYTPAEALQWLKENDNTITLTFKK